MSLRELHKRLDQLERRAMTEKTGILPIIDCVDLDTIERWSTYTAADRDQLRADIERRQRERVDVVTAERPSDSFQLAAIVVRDWIPDEDNIWRLDFDEAEPERPKAEPVELPSQTWPELRGAYADVNDRRRAQRSADACYPDLGP